MAAFRVIGEGVHYIADRCKYVRSVKTATMFEFDLGAGPEVLLNIEPRGKLEQAVADLQQTWPALKLEQVDTCS